MAENYTVNYTINVNSNSAIAAITQFQTAASKLTEIEAKFKAFQNNINAMGKKAPTVKINTGVATRKLDTLIGKLRTINKLVKENRTLAITTSGSRLGNTRTAGASGTSNGGKPVAGGTSNGGNQSGGKNPSGKPAGAAVLRSNNLSKNIGYKLFGPTPLPNNGGLAIDMLKGMGIAYGIAGLGSAIGSIVSYAQEYDNLIKTVENILKTHDEKGNFSNRMSSMTQTVRNVGMETKFTITQVADAAKFLAMAGLDLEGIQQAIRPIADIAIVGDTDLGQTADLVTNIMTAYNIAPKKMRNAADVMTNTFTMTNTTLTEIAESYKYAASLLSAADVPFEQATAAIGVLGDAGIKASQAGTTLRTIMANVANPTKKQQKAWDRIGIKTKDANGDPRDLLQIFRELHEKDLGVADYYQIFHKTAASGAVALASHVDKWEKVDLENYLSGGLAARLADEKKNNTLQGLWYQLTSVFQDRGVTAFQGVQGGIRNWMRSAIDWMLTDEATATFREVANTMMQFTQTVIDASKWFFHFYKMFAPMINAWVKFQLMIWPVVKAMSAFRSIWFGLQGLRNVGVTIATLAKNMWNLGEATTKANLAAEEGSVIGATGGAVGFKGGMKNFGRGIWKGAKRFGGMGAGMLGVGVGLHQATKEGANTADLWSGGFWGAAGIAAMVGGPIGWIAAAGFAVAGLGASLVSFYTNLNTLSGYVKNFTTTHQLLDGALTSGKTTTERYLEFVWRKNYDINDLIQRRVELTKKLAGIESPDATTINDVGTETYKELYKKFYAADSMWGSSPAASKAAELFNEYGKEFNMGVYKDADGNWYMRDADGKAIKYNNPSGTSDTNDAVMYDVAAAMEMLHGSYRAKVMDENQHRLAQMLYGRSTAADVENWRDTFAKTYGPASWAEKIRPDKWNVSTEEAEVWNGEDISKSYLGSVLMWRSMYQMVNAQNALVEFKRKLEAGKLQEADVVNALRWGDYDILGQTLADYDPNNIAGWFKNLGYAGNGVWRDPSGRETPEVMAQTAATQMEKLLQAIHRTNLEDNPATKNLQMYANTLLTLAQAANGGGDGISGKKNGEIKTVNGVKWRWNANTNLWELANADVTKNDKTESSSTLIPTSDGTQRIFSTPWSKYSKVSTQSKEVEDAWYKGLADWWKDTKEKLLPQISNIWNILKDKATNAFKFLKIEAVLITAPIVKWWMDLKTSVANWWDGVVSSIKNFVTNAVALLKVEAMLVITPIIKAWNDLKTSVSNWWSNIIRVIKENVTSAFRSLQLGWQSFITPIQMLWDSVTTSIANWWDGVYQWGTDVLNQIGDFFTSVGNTISGWWSSALAWIREQIANSELLQAILGFASSLWDSIKSLGKVLSDLMTNLWDGIVTWIKQQIANTPWLSKVCEWLGIDLTSSLPNNNTNITQDEKTAPDQPLSYTSSFDWTKPLWQANNTDWLSTPWSSATAAVNTASDNLTPNSGAVTMTPQQMGGATSNKDKSDKSGFNKGGGKGSGSDGKNGSKGSGNTGAKASDYKSHYNSGNAAPKQVIVKINQLMNVDKIDLSNPDNAAVIANLKQQLTQALVDVVHDFDESWNG